MRRGFMLALAGSLLALLGPVVLPFVTVIEEETSLAGYQLDTGLASLGLALVGLGVAAWFGRRRVQKAGWALASFATAQLALMTWTYMDVWRLVPCTAEGLSGCDARTGGLIENTLVSLDWGMAVGVLGAALAVVGALLVLLAHPQYGKAARFLRVGLRWQGETVSQRIYFRRKAVTVGEADFAAFQLPAAGLRLHQLLTPVKGASDAWYLTVPAGMGAQCHVGGEPRELAGGDVVRVHRGDAGLIQAGPDLSLSFDFMAAETAVLDGGTNPDDAGLAVSFTLAAGMVLMLLFSAFMQQRRTSRLGLTESLAMHQDAMIPVEVALPDEEDPEPLSETPEEEVTAKAAPEDEGRFGKPDRTAKSKVPRREAPVVHETKVDDLGIAKVLGGKAALTGALGTVMSGETEALNSKMEVAMAGEGAELVIGHGSDGLGFRGTGTGGGGPGGFGALRGRGRIHVGARVGRRANVGLGKKRGRRVGELEIRAPRAEGFCERGDLSKVIRRKAAAFRACYERELMSHPGLRGKLTLQWTVDVRGRTQRQKIASDTLHNHRVGDCVLRQLRHMRFKKPEGGVCVVRFPLMFSPG